MLLWLDVGGIFRCDRHANVTQIRMLAIVLQGKSIHVREAE